MTNTTPAPTIDEQIDKYGLDSMKPHILATLRAHKAIMEAERPEPVAWGVFSPEYGLTYSATYELAAQEHINDAINEHDFLDAAKWFVRPLYGPDLLAYAERMRVERDEAREATATWAKAHNMQMKRAELAESQRDALLAENAKLKLDLHTALSQGMEACSQRDALIALMREPDEEMLDAAWREIEQVGHGFEDAWKAMSAVALRKACP